VAEARASSSVGRAADF